MVLYCQVRGLYTMDRYTISNLRAYYGDLLTNKQNEMLRLRYDEDMSLSEIADEFSVSRQAVVDAVKSGEKSLADYENKLRLFEQNTSLGQQIDLAVRAINDGNLEVALDALLSAREILE